MPAELLSDHVKIVMHRLRHHFCISLRLRDVGMPQHLADVFDFDTISEHVRGEGMPCEVGVQARLDASHHAQGFELVVIVCVVHLRNAHVVLFKDSQRRRQDAADIRHTRLDTLASIRPSFPVPSVVVYVESLHVAVRETSVELKDKQIMRDV